MKINEGKKIDKYLYFGRELKKLWNMRVTKIPIVLGAFGTISKAWKKDRRNWKSEEELRPSTQQLC